MISPFLNYRLMRLLPSWKHPTATPEWDKKGNNCHSFLLVQTLYPKGSQLPTQYQLWDHLSDCFCLSMGPYEGVGELQGRQFSRSGQSRVGGQWQHSGILSCAHLGNTSSYLPFRLQGIRQKCRPHARDFELCIKLIMPQYASYVNK